MLSKEQIEALIRDYIFENLKVSVEVNRYSSYGETPTVRVSVFLAGEWVSDSYDVLPEPKISYSY